MSVLHIFLVVSCCFISSSIFRLFFAIIFHACISGCGFVWLPFRVLFRCEIRRHNVSCLFVSGDSGELQGSPSRVLFLVVVVLVVALDSNIVGRIIGILRFHVNV